jgi:hypothetical protein
VTDERSLKDSGDRTEQYGGAMRDRAPGKGRFDLISPFFLQDLAVLLEEGARKYAVRNWERGYSLPLCLDSAQRHLTQLAAGMDDEDHALQAACNLMFFIHMRHLIRQGLLPEDLADYVPLHIVNPVTGRVDRGTGPERTEGTDNLCARCREPRGQHKVGGCTFTGRGTKSRCLNCNNNITWDGRKWKDSALTSPDICFGSARPNVAHEPEDLS